MISRDVKTEGGGAIRHGLMVIPPAPIGPRTWVFVHNSGKTAFQINNINAWEV